MKPAFEFSFLQCLQREGIVVVYSSMTAYIVEPCYFLMADFRDCAWRFMYEESFRTPLLVRLPGGKKGDVDEMVQNIDYGPTILDLAGVEVPADMHGVSFLPLLKGEKVSDWRKSLYYHFYEYPAEHAVRRHYGVRTERYKLMHFYNDIDCWELYDLQEDPMEMHNIYGQPGTEELVKELKTELLRLQVQYDDPIRNIYKD